MIQTETVSIEENLVRTGSLFQSVIFDISPYS